LKWLYIIKQAKIQLGVSLNAEHIRELKMNKLVKIMSYNFFEGEWAGNCGACLKDLYAPTKGEYLLNYTIHTHSDDCLGGY